MDMLKKLKSVFIVDGGSTVKDETIEVNSSDSSVSKEKIATNTASTTEPIVDIQIEAPMVDGSTPDPKFVEILLKAIEENNLQGFDYLEYKSSLQSLSKMSMDDATKYQSAMAMAKTMGASKDKVVQSANHYLHILSKENDKFQSAVQSQKSKITQDQESGIKNLELSIQNKKRQIEQITKEIELETKKMEEMKNNINSSTAKISETTAKFNYAYKLDGGV